jgi:hypothetical protein
MIDVLTKVPSPLKTMFFPLFLSFTINLSLPKRTEVDLAEGEEIPPGDNFPYIGSGIGWLKG